MTTVFALLLGRCGLSHTDAAAFLGVRPDTVRSWSIGRNQTPDRVIAQLRALHARIERSAAEALDAIDAQAAARGEPGTIELGIASDAREAQDLGWPCVGAQAASLGLVVARSSRAIAIVPRASTPATAAAAQAHEGGR